MEASLAPNIRHGEGLLVDAFLEVDGQREGNPGRGHTPCASRDRGPADRILLVDICIPFRGHRRNRFAPMGLVRRVAPASCR